MNGYVFNAGDFPGSSAESSQHTFLIIIAVVFVLSVIALIIYLKCVMKKSAPKGSGEIKKVIVTLIGSKEEAVGGIGTITKYIFEDKNGQRIILVIKPSDAEGLVKGDKGILCYQGKKFLSFTRQ